MLKEKQNNAELNVLELVSSVIKSEIVWTCDDSNRIEHCTIHCNHES